VKKTGGRVADPAIRGMGSGVDGMEKANRRSIADSNGCYHGSECPRAKFNPI
jgi:hypothetical protein